MLFVLVFFKAIKDKLRVAKHYMGCQIIFSTSDCGSYSFINASMPGSVLSPNYPNPYFHYATCSWAIKAEPGYDVVLSFNHFDIESTFDHLMVIS